MLTGLRQPCRYNSRRRGSGDDVGSELILDKGDAVTQGELALLQPLELQAIRRSKMRQRIDCSVEITVFLPQMLKLRLQRGPLFLAQFLCHERFVLDHRYCKIALAAKQRFLARTTDSLGEETLQGL